MNTPLFEETTNIIRDRVKSNLCLKRNNQNLHASSRADSQIFNSTLSEVKLKRICRTHHLENVKTLELIIDSNYVDFGNLTDFLPSLINLILDGSKIRSLRDIGACGIQNLTMLSAANCGIHDLDGFSIFPNLKEVRLSHNEIVDLTPLVLHECIENIDLSYNKIIHINAIEILGSCPNLRNIDIRSNPIVADHNTIKSDIRQHIPQVEVINGKQVESKCNIFCSINHRDILNHNKSQRKKDNETLGSFEMIGNTARSIMRRRSSLEFIKKYDVDDGSARRIEGNNNFPISLTKRYVEKSDQLIAIEKNNRPQTASTATLKSEIESKDNYNTWKNECGVEPDLFGYNEKCDSRDISKQKRSRQIKKARHTAREIAFEDEDLGDISDDDFEYLDLVATRATMKSWSA